MFADAPLTVLVLGMLGLLVLVASTALIVLAERAEPGGAALALVPDPWGPVEPATG